MGEHLVPDYQKSEQADSFREEGEGPEVVVRVTPP